MEDLAKQAAGYAAADLIKNGMTVGLGTGSTSEYFIHRLSERCREGLNIVAVASSLRSKALALRLNIPLIDLEDISTLDIAVDGADEIDPERCMIKGGGGAMLREKIIAHMAKEMVVIIDDSKRVSMLGAVPLPVEIIPFAWRSTERHLMEMGFSGSLRMTNESTRFITDNGNYIYDLQIENGIHDPVAVDIGIRSIPGAIETGLFYNPVARVIIGYKDGSVEYIKESKGATWAES